MKNNKVMKTIFVKVEIIVVFVVLILVVFSCKRSQPIMPIIDKDCQGRTEVSADFKMLEKATSDIAQLYTDTDTIFAGKYVRFVAKEQDAQEYKWYLEDGSIIKVKEFERYFDIDLAGTYFTLSLVVKKNKVDLLCFPNDDGYDSITKTLYIAPRLPNPPNEGWDAYYLNGNYRFYSQSLNDSIDIKFYDRFLITDSSSFGIAYPMYIHNFDGKGSYYQGVYGYICRNYRGINCSIKREGLPSYPSHKVYVYDFTLSVDLDGTAYFSMKNRYPWSKLPEFNYKGHKL